MRGTHTDHIGKPISSHTVYSCNALCLEALVKTVPTCTWDDNASKISSIVPSLVWFNSLVIIVDVLFLESDAAIAEDVDLLLLGREHIESGQVTYTTGSDGLPAFQLLPNHHLRWPVSQVTLSTSCNVHTSSEIVHTLPTYTD